MHLCHIRIAITLIAFYAWPIKINQKNKLWTFSLTKFFSGVMKSKVMYDATRAFQNQKYLSIGTSVCNLNADNKYIPNWWRMSKRRPKNLTVNNQEISSALLNPLTLLHTISS